MYKTMTRKPLPLIAAALAICASGFSQTIITDASLTETSDITWTAGTDYTVNGLAYLEEGGKLTIEAGTVVKFRSTPTDNGAGDNTSALIIARGAQIFINGTAEDPVIFTFEGDDTSDPDDVDPLTRGQWGGLIILGRATVARPGGVDQIEGIPTTAGVRAQYGGGTNPDDDDNSGRINYLSIRHGGRALASGDEINGLTLGGVGRGTEIDFVEVFSNDDDGIEWFGGTVDVRHAVVAFGKDDSYDYDYGWRGRGQYWFSINSADISGRGGEHDGAAPDDQTPFANPTIANATYIGSGVGSTPGEDGNDFAIAMRDNAGGKYYNSVFTDFPEKWLAIEDLPAASGVDSRERLANGDIVFSGNVLGSFGDGSTLDAIIEVTGDGVATVADIISDLGTGNRLTGDGLVLGITRSEDGGLDPRPIAGGPLRDRAALVAAEDFLKPNSELEDGFFQEVGYAGAFGGQNWATGWTALDEYGFFSDLAPDDNVVEINDASLTGTSDLTWTNDNIYLVDGLTYLEEGGKLTIQAGTVVKFIGSPASTSDNTSALIVTRGAQIFIDGTADEPVIFTFEDDDTDDNDDFDALTRGQWGGLIILGRATVARPGGVDQIEGIPVTAGIRAQYGGGTTPDDDDNSGRINYLSIRHGGRALASGDEINGLTLGGVGRGTEIDYVEVFANDDDGIEWFGGTVDIKHAAVAFGKDDSYDYDYGWRGRGQYWFSINSTDVSGRAGEHDGATPDDQQPFSNPTISNATYIGSGVGSSPGEDGNDFAIVMRDNAGGKYFNSIFADFPEDAINIEDLPTASGTDSYQRFLDGDIRFQNNFFSDFGGGSTFGDLVRTYDAGDDPDASDIITYLGANNTIGSANIAGISREQDGMGLDPRLNAGDALYSGNVSFLTEFNSDGFFEPTTYVGAFDNQEDGNWLRGWSALDAYGYFGDIAVITGIEEVVEGARVELFPNPTNATANLRFELIAAGEVAVEIYDVTGRMISSRGASLTAGSQVVSLDVAELVAGTYVVRLVTEAGAVTRSLAVAR